MDESSEERQTRLRGANEEVISLDRDTGYANDDDGLLWWLWSGISLWWVWWWWWDGRESGWKWNWMRNWKLLVRIEGVVVIVNIVYVR